MSVALLCDEVFKLLKLCFFNIAKFAFGDVSATEQPAAHRVSLQRHEWVVRIPSPVMQQVLDALHLGVHWAILFGPLIGQDRKFQENQHKF